MLLTVLKKKIYILTPQNSWETSNMGT